MQRIDRTKFRGYTMQFCLAGAPQTKFSLSNKFSWNPGCVLQIFTHVLSTSRKHLTLIIAKSFGECCESTRYWLLSFIGLQGIVFLLRNLRPWPAELNQNGSPKEFEPKGICNVASCHCLYEFSDSHSPVDVSVTAGSFRITVDFLRSIWCCLRLLNKAFKIHLIEILVRAIKWELNLTLKSL